MLQKILLALLVLATGFAVSGVSAVVLAEVKADIQVSELTTVDLEKERQEVRLVTQKEVASDEILESEVDSITVKEEEVERLRRPSSQKNKPKLVETGKEQEEVKNIGPVESNAKPVHISNTQKESAGSVFSVPFYSQFTDITPAAWQKVGCGVASLTMLVDFYKPNSATVDELLQKGIASGAYITSAGWSHQGLINLSKEFGLDGQSVSLANLSMDGAFESLKVVLDEGPVMASVHYTFLPTNPIPHLVVINGVKDGKVFYNDPAEKSGGGSISIAQFQSAWKKRYIEIRPVT